MATSPTIGLTMSERFYSPDWMIQSVSGGCKHTTYWNVVVVNRHCDHRKVVHHTHNYRAHWDAMYRASEHFIVNDGAFDGK